MDFLANAQSVQQWLKRLAVVSTWYVESAITNGVGHVALLIKVSFITSKQEA